MTSISRLSGITAIALGAALSMTAGLAVAGEVVSADQISKALQSKPLTRGLSAGRAADRYGGSGERDQIRRRPAQPQDAVALARRA